MDLSKVLILLTASLISSRFARSVPVGNSLIYFNPPPLVDATDAFGNINTLGLFDIGRKKWPEDKDLLRLAYQPRRSVVPLKKLSEWYAPFYDKNFSEQLANEQLLRRR